jgi:hypothetical protein
MKTKLSMEVGNYVFVKPTSFQFLMILDVYYKVFLGKTIVQFIEIGLSQTTPCMGIYSGNACGLQHYLAFKNQCWVVFTFL